MKKSNKILLGLATIWLPVYIILLMIFFLAVIAFGPGPGRPRPQSELMGALVIVGTIIHFVTIFGSLGLTVYYIIHVLRNGAVKSDMRIVWVLLLFFVGIFAQPVYWYLNIWRQKPEPDGYGPYAGRLDPADSAPRVGP